MNWDDLSIFRATAEELSFTRAAARLRLSVSAVSQRVQRLERTVGTRLLDRTTTRVQLTPAGRRVLEAALHIEETWQRTVSDVATGVQAADEPRGPVRMGFLRAGHRNPLWPRLCALTPDRPWEPRHYSVPSSGFRDLRTGDADFFLWSALYGEATMPDLDLTGLSSVDIVREPVWLAMSVDHPLTAFDLVAFAQLAPYPWVAPTGAEERDLMTALCREYGGFVPTFAHELDAYQDVMDVLRDTQAIDVGPPSSPPHPGVARRPLDAAPTSRYALTWRSGGPVADLAPAVLALVRHRYAEKSQAWNPQHWAYIEAHPATYPGIAGALTSPEAAPATSPEAAPATASAALTPPVGGTTAAR